MMDLVISGMDSIFDKPTTPFITEKAWDIIYEGIVINCNKTEFGAKVICAVLKNEMSDKVERLNETHLGLSILKSVSKKVVAELEISAKSAPTPCSFFRFRKVFHLVTKKSFKAKKSLRTSFKIFFSSTSVSELKITKEI